MHSPSMPEPSVYNIGLTIGMSLVPCQQLKSLSFMSGWWCLPALTICGRMSRRAPLIGNRGHHRVTVAGGTCAAPCYRRCLIPPLLSGLRRKSAAAALSAADTIKPGGGRRQIDLPSPPAAPSTAAGGGALPACVPGRHQPAAHWEPPSDVTGKS